MKNIPLNKRFWDVATFRAADDGFAIYLDDRPLKTPLKAALTAPTKALAEAIVAEWNDVEDTVDPRKMHWTRCANATIDKVMPAPDAVADMLAKYGETDLLCYRADAPVALVARQGASWDPVLAWLVAAHGIELRTTNGVMYIRQPAESLVKLRGMIGTFTPWQLTGFHDLVTISGSLVLALAIVEGHLTPAAAWDISRVDEMWQEEQWGRDDAAHDAAIISRDALFKAVRLFDLLA